MNKRLFGSIIKRGRNYIGKYGIKGHYYYTPTMHTKSEVQHLLNKIHADIVHGTWQPPQQTRNQLPTSLTINQWIPIWINKMEKRGLSPNTIRSYKSRWESHIEPYFGENTPLTQISTHDIEKFIDHLAATQTPSTRLSIMRDFSSGLTAAFKAGALETKPEMPEGFFKRQPPKSVDKLTTYTYAQIFQLVEACEPRYRAAIILGGIGALRSAEVAPLTRADIAPNGKAVTVNKAVKRGIGGKLSLGTPKSMAGYRTVHFDERSAQVLQAHLEIFVPPNSASLLFPPVNPRSPFVTDKVLRKALTDSADKANLPRGWFHDLRHSALTMYGQAGATIADLMARAGHTKPETVMIYQHSTAQRDAELTARMSQ